MAKKKKKQKTSKEEKVSIAIITLNEEKYIEKLLKSIKAQKYPCEIIVVDGKSRDKTRKLAKKHTKNVFVLKDRNISRSRNLGGRKAKNNIIVFLDADVILPKNFLKDNVAEFKKRKLGIATVSIKPISPKKSDHLGCWIYNVFQRAMQFTPKPFAAGNCIMVRRDVFKKTGGFNPNVYYTDDCEFAIRAKKHRFGILHGPKILGSVRRADKIGRPKFVFTVLRYTLRRLFVGEYTVENSMIKKNYKFGEF
ncbi:glycosyltransferase [Candidatus Woesearchaeota archaeon]|nr:glycosyltransferase [Candidatus Woesearchaeota archaeon]